MIFRLSFFTTLRAVLILASLGYSVSTFSQPLPVGHWTFDEGTGTTAFDTGTGTITPSNGDLINGVTWIPGKVGGAVKFDGVNDYINVGTDIFGLSSQLTIAFWVRFDSPAVSQGLVVRDGGVRPFRIERGSTGLITTGIRVTAGNNTLNSLSTV